MEKNPFSLYDFLGYFVPGALCLFLCNKALTLPIDIHKWTLNAFFNLGIDSSNPITIFVLIVFSYSLGHLISYLSSISIERYANIQYSYPSNYLIKDINKIETIFRLNFFLKNDTIKDVVRVFLCRFVLLCILAPFCLIDLFIGRFLGVRYFFIKKLDDVQVKWYEKKENSLLNKLHLNIDRNTDEYINCDIHRIIHHYVYESIGKQSVKFDNYVALYGFLRALTLILLLFYFIISFRFGLNYILFWLFLLFIVVASFTSKNTNEVSNPDTSRSLQYVTLKNKNIVYGFLCLAFLFLLYIIYKNNQSVFWDVYLFHMDRCNISLYLLISFICLTLCYLSFMGFMKFYRRYTLLAFMCLLVDENIN